MSAGCEYRKEEEEVEMGGERGLGCEEGRRMPLWLLWSPLGAWPGDARDTDCTEDLKKRRRLLIYM